jgi:hypothetical protein
MSFTCQGCGEPQKARVKPIKVVTEIHHVTYPTIQKNGKEYTPQGYEIDKELNLCKKCAKKYEEV